MATPVGFWIFTEEQYLFLKPFFDAFELSESDFHSSNGLYYLAEGEVPGWTDDDWEDWFFDAEFEGECRPGYSAFLWSQTPWKVS